MDTKEIYNDDSVIVLEVKRFGGSVFVFVNDYGVSESFLWMDDDDYMHDTRDLLEYYAKVLPHTNLTKQERIDKFNAYLRWLNMEGANIGDEDAAEISKYWVENFQ